MAAAAASMVVVGSDELALVMVMWPHALWSCDAITLSIANVYLTYNGSVV